ncbi:DUF362 domain-containing protein [bacterium]|nr:DUF362 domain-containing protein [bacterium]
MVKRRDFIKTGMAALPGLAVLAGSVHAAPKSIESPGGRADPGINLVKDGISYAEKHKKGNIPPVLREEILDNPRAVFLIRTNIDLQREQDGKFPAAKEKFQLAGYDTALRMFRKGTIKGGTTYIKPNFVGGFNDDERSLNCGHSTHPSFVVGFCDGLKGLGNTNIIVGSNGAASHEQFVQSGISEMMRDHGVCFTEGGRALYKWGDYKKSDITWIDYPEGVVMKKIPFFKLVQEKDTTLIDMAKTRNNLVCFTTLTIKNFQGTMPVGYMHICNPWHPGAGHGNNNTWSIKNAMSLQPSVQVFNPDYQKEIERLYVKHAQMGYKYWDIGGQAKAYFDAGGWEAYKNNTFKPDMTLFWEEQWSQRILDVVSNVKPYVVMVEGITGADGAGALHLNNFITISCSMVECDAVTAWLMGQDPRELPYLRNANERGLGNNNIETITIYEITKDGIERINDYRTLPRGHMGADIYGLTRKDLRFF